MNTHAFYFKVGKFDCIAVSDGSVTGEGAAQVLFANAPKRLLKQTLRAYNFPDRWAELFTCLVVDTGKHCVLIDTGLGSIAGEASAGKLVENLHREGIEPGDIDTIIISHAHGDHIGGIANAQGLANFAQAHYFIRKEEWDFWTSHETLANPGHQWMVEFVNKNLIPFHDRFHFLTADNEIVPGILSIFAPGHTPGNMALIVESVGEKLYYLGDIVLHPIHLEYPNWYSSVDCMPDQVDKTRWPLLNRVSAEKSLVFFYHFDFPGLGYILPQAENWKWQAIEAG